MYEVVIGIDFGSSGTGYAYSFNNTEDIILGYFDGQGTNVKVPTEIILDKDLNNVLAFGEKCKDYIGANQMNEGELHFKRIKMSLYEKKRTINPQNNSKEYPINLIISKILGYVKKEATKKIKENRPSIDENKIKWVLTVPAIWNEEQKGIMIKASEEAGLINQKTDRSNFFALEPEAASLYCSQDTAIDPKYIQPGKTYIVCDLGGGTGDIVTQYKKEKNDLKEKYPATGGKFGSNEIDKDVFDLVLGEIFGFKDYNSLKEKNEKTGFKWNNDELYNEWINLENEIEKRKKITEETKDFPLNCGLFKDFMDNKKITELVDSYNNKECQNGNGWKITVKNENRWIITFPNKIFYDLIIAQAKKINQQIKTIIENTPNIESILYVGGYCSNEILVNYIKNNFKNLAHLKPSRPVEAIVKGAVLFGINPNIITERKAKYSIGLRIRKEWDEKIHGEKGEKIFDEKLKSYRCKDCFCSFIEKEQTLSINYTIKHNLFLVGSRYGRLTFYRSYKKNPIFCTEEGVEKIGEDLLDLKRDFKENERNIVVLMKFGGTYVEAECIHEKSGERVKTNLYFNK